MTSQPQNSRSTGVPGRAGSRDVPDPAGPRPAGPDPAGGDPVAVDDPVAAGPGAAPAEHAPGIPATALASQQWPGILALFVDDPRGAVERASAAAREQAAALAAALEREQSALRAAWPDGASTEDLRTALQQYRSFCGRLEGLNLG